MSSSSIFERSFEATGHPGRGMFNVMAFLEDILSLMRARGFVQGRGTSLSDQDRGAGPRTQPVENLFRCNTGVLFCTGGRRKQEENSTFDRSWFGLQCFLEKKGRSRIEPACSRERILHAPGQEQYPVENTRIFRRIPKCFHQNSSAAGASQRRNLVNESSRLSPSTRFSIS